MEQGKLTGAGHMYAVNLNKMNYNSKTVQDIFLKFSPFVTHKSVVNWWKNFGRSTTNMSATPLFVSKLCEGLAPILFEIWSKNFFWWGSRPISVTQWQEFQISPKKWRFEIFGTSAPSRGNRVIHGQTMKISFGYADVYANISLTLFYMGSRIYLSTQGGQVDPPG